MTQTRIALPAQTCRRSAQLIRTMEDDGWTGRVSARQHVIMRAPDGRTTCSVRLKETTPTERRNDEAAYKRWKTAQAAIQTPVQVEDLLTDEPVSELVEVRPEVVDTTPEPVRRWDCDECDRDFQSQQYLNVHKVRAHVRVECPVCDQSFSPGNLPRHQATHEREFPTMALTLREISRLRAEVQTWQVLAEDAESRYVRLADRVQGVVDALNDQ